MLWQPRGKPLDVGSNLSQFSKCNKLSFKVGFKKRLTINRIINFFPIFEEIIGIVKIIVEFSTEITVLRSEKWFQRMSVCSNNFFAVVSN